MSFPFNLKTFVEQPGDGYILTYDASTKSWYAGSTTVYLTGDVDGSSAGTTVVALQHVPIDGTEPTDGQILSYSSVDGYWHATDASAGSFTAGGDLSGTDSSQTVQKIHGNAVDAIVNSTAQDGYVLTWSASGNKYQASQIIVPTSLPIAGDVTGTTSSSVVEKIHGATVPAAGGLTTNHLLKVSGASALSYALLVNANVDAGAAIAYSKLSLGGSIVNADISSGAAIDPSKINLSAAIVNGDLSALAAIDVSKLAAGTDGYVISTVAGVPTWTIQVPRQYEISFETGLASSTSTLNYSRCGAKQIDMTPYPATIGALTRTVKFVANVDKTSGATNCTIQLYDTTNNVLVTSTQLTSTSNSNAPVTTAGLTVGSSSGNIRSDAPTNYECQFIMVGGGVSDAVFVTSARLLITYA